MKWIPVNFSLDLRPQIFEAEIYASKKNVNPADNQLTIKTSWVYFTAST